MITNENSLDDLKKKLYRLHFLLTEKENTDSVKKSLQQFIECFNHAMSELSAFLENEYKLAAGNNMEIAELSFQYKLINKEMSQEFKQMITDAEILEQIDSPEKIYSNIKIHHAGHLQMIYDMLSRMGQDAEDE